MRALPAGAERSDDLPLSIEQETLARASPRRLRQAKFPLAFALVGRLDVEALATALRAVLGGHEALRLRLVRTPDGQLRQRFAPVAAGPPFDVVDVPDVAGALAVLRAQLLAPMHLVHPATGSASSGEGAGPFRAVLLRLSEDRWILGCTVHHLAWDERSRAVFGAELAGAYAAATGAGSVPPRLPGAWARHVRGQHAAGTTLPAATLDWWREHLAGTNAMPGLPADPRTDPQAREWSAALTAEPLDRAAMQAVANFARRSRSTVPAVIHTLLARSLAEWASAEAIRYYYLHHGRDHRWQADVVGFFARQVPLVYRVDPMQSLAETCRGVMRDGAGVVARTGAPFSVPRLMTELRRSEPAAPLPDTPLARVMLNLDVMDLPAAPAPPDAQLQVRPLARPAAAGGAPSIAPIPPGRLWIWAHVGPETVLRAEFDRRSYPPADVEAILTGVSRAIAELP